MKKTSTKSKLVLAAFALSMIASILPRSTFAQDIQSSVLTVDELLKIDNDQALEKARSEAIKAGFLQPAKKSNAKGDSVIVIPAPVWKLKSIFGTFDRLKADVSVDGVTTTNIRIGSKVASCDVVVIDNFCIQLAPETKKTKKDACPARVCWTGIELAAELQPVQVGNSSVAGSRMTLATSPLPPAALPIPSASNLTVPR